MTQIVDVVIPILNEAPTIPALFEALMPLVERGVIRRVVVGDNGSTDGSQDLVRAAGGIVVEEAEVRGYGAACLAAIGWIRDEGGAEGVGLPIGLAFFDGDLSDDVGGLERLIDALLDCDLALGSRGRLAERGALNFAQRFGGVLATSLIFVTTGKRYRDLGPMRVVRWEAFERLRMVDRTWGWTVEMQMKAAIAGLRVVEIDVPYFKRHSGKSKITGTVMGVLRAGFKIVWTIFVIRLFWRRPKD